VTIIIIISDVLGEWQQHLLEVLYNSPYDMGWFITFKVKVVARLGWFSVSLGS
jgi:hypothetical protein